MITSFRGFCAQQPLDLDLKNKAKNVVPKCFEKSFLD